MHPSRTCRPSARSPGMREGAVVLVVSAVVRGRGGGGGGVRAGGAGEEGEDDGQAEEEQDELARRTEHLGGSTVGQHAHTAQATQHKGAVT